jgi:hypothetical protein
LSVKRNVSGEDEKMEGAKPDLVGVLARLETIERENRRLGQWGVVVVLGIVALALMGAVAGKGTKVVEAQRFVVRDRDGNVRGEFGYTDEHSVTLRILDGKGKNRIDLRVDVLDSPLFTLRDRKDMARITLGIDPRTAMLDNWALIFSDGDGKRQAELSTDEGGPKGLEARWVKTKLVLFDDRGKERVDLGVHENGAPGLSLWDANSTLRAWLALREDRAPILTLSDESGVSRLSLGNELIETTRTGGIEERPTSSVVMFDRDGKVFWKVP